MESAADKGEQFDPSVESLGKTSETLQWVGYGLGAAAIVTGIIIYATAPGERAENTPATTPSVAVAPLAGPTTGGAALRVTF